MPIYEYACHQCGNEFEALVRSGTVPECPSLSIALVLLLFGIWEIYATYRGHWQFNPAAVWKIRIINLPLEEVLFFIVIPFCPIFTWETVKYFRGRPR